MARRTFTTEFKTAAVKLVAEQGYTQKQTAQSLGVDLSSIRGWIRLYTPALHGSSVVPIDAKGLQVENHRLLLEREILKKATVFFAKKQS